MGQENDVLCGQCSQQQEFKMDEDGILYRQGKMKQPRVIIPNSLDPVIFKSYHVLPFMSHEGDGRTPEFIK